MNRSSKPVWETSVETQMRKTTITSKNFKTEEKHWDMFGRKEKNNRTIKDKSEGTGRKKEELKDTEIGSNDTDKTKTFQNHETKFNQ